MRASTWANVLVAILFLGFMVWGLLPTPTQSQLHKAIHTPNPMVCMTPEEIKDLEDQVSQACVKACLAREGHSP